MFRIRKALPLFFFAVATVTSQAQDDGTEIGRFLDKTHVISLGAVRQTMDAGIRSTVGDRDPSEITLQELGIDDKDSSYYFSYQYRWKPRWTLLGGAYRFVGTGGQRAQRDFNYDGVDYSAGVALVSKFEADAYLVDVMYSVSQGKNYDIAVGGGIHALDLGVSIDAAASVDGEERRVNRSGATLLAPVPNLRASVTWEPNRHIVLNAIGGWLSANAGDYDGDFTYVNMRAMYRITDRFGVALSYQRTDIDITKSGERSETNFDLRFDGPALSLVYAL